MVDVYGWGAGDVAPITYLTGAIGGTEMGGIIGGAIQGLATLAASGINAGVNSYNVAQTNISNEKIAEEARDLQEKMYNKSLDLEERKFAEQQYENLISRYREDTEVQRRMKDLEAAGINPLLAGKYDSQTGWGSVANAGVQGITPVTSMNQAAQIGINGGDWSGLAAALREQDQRTFQAGENEKNRRLEQEKLDIDRYNAETSRMQEENSAKYKELENQLANKQLDEKIRHNLEQEKSSVDQLNALLKKTANDYDIAKQNAKNAEERLKMDKLNSEAQRKITAVQGILMNNRISYEEKEAAIKAEEHEWQRQLTGMQLTEKTVNTALGIFDRIKECVFFWQGRKN